MRTYQTIGRRMSMMRMAWMTIVICAVIFFAGCEEDLSATYDEFRDQVPSMCKDYCEEKVACERVSGTGVEDEEAFTSQVHFCEVECGTFAAEGAYVWQVDSTGLYDREYILHLSGDQVMDAFSCLYQMGAYRCVGTDNDYIHEFNPPAINICEAANDCVEGFNLDHSYYWQANSNGIGGACHKRGTEFIDDLFF